MKKLASYGFLIAALGFTSCTKTEKTIERLPPENVAKSFGVQEESALVLKKASLGKAFLMLANSKKLSSAPDWHDHVAQIVSFEKYGSRVGLYELGKDQIYENISASRLLQSFKVLKETDSEIYIDLDQGFRSLDMAENLETYADEESDYFMKRIGAKPRIEIVESVVQSKSLEDNRLKIVQDSRLRELKIVTAPDKNASGVIMEQATKAYEYSVQTHYEFLPYTENKNFQPKQIDMGFRVGFFARKISQPHSSETSKVAVRWDTSDSLPPIRFILSKDIPSEYLSEIRKGLLYWNRVFGKTVLTIEQSTESDLLPQDRSVLVRWVDWKDASFAYAGFQVNPITGEILRGQIFLPSFWSLDQEDKYGPGFEDVPGSIPTKEKLKRLKLVMTVAHEAGHVFGLRHNFAGSSSVKTSITLLNEVKELFRKGRIDEKKVLSSTSVMDYQFDLDGAVVSKFLDDDVLAYDRDAIAWGYLNQENPDTLVGQFCTDDHISLANQKGGEVLGCERGDAAGNAFLLSFGSLQKNFVSNSLKYAIQSLIGSIYPSSGERKPLAKDSWAYFSEVGMDELGKKLLFERRYDGVLKNTLYSIEALNQIVPRAMKLEPETEIYDAFLGTQIQTLIEDAKKDPAFGKMVTLKDDNGQVDFSWIDQALEDLLKSPTILNGEISGGRKYQLTAEDLAEIRAVLRYRAEDIKKAFLLSYAAAVLPNDKLMDYDYKTKKNLEYSTSYRGGVAGLDLPKLGSSAILQALKITSSPSVIGKVLDTPYIATRTPISSSDLEKWLPVLKKQSPDFEKSFNELRVSFREPLEKLISVLGGNPSMKTEEMGPFINQSWMANKIDKDVLTWASLQLRALIALEGPPALK